MRVIAGELRSRKLIPPKGPLTRPITDRAKESIFNMLASLGVLEDAKVLDLYAGSGSFGIESLSRGADYVDFVERSQAGVEALNTNISTLGLGLKSRVHKVGVETFLKGNASSVYDIVFCDPPYKDNPWSDIFALINSSLLVGHAADPIELAASWDEVRRRTYGRSHILIAESVGVGDDNG